MVISKMETTTKHDTIKGKIQQILEAMEAAGSKERAKSVQQLKDEGTV